MNIEISKHGLNFGEDLEYISTFIKGKGKVKPENYRILVKGVKTGKEGLLMLSPHDNFFGRKLSYMMDYIDDFKYITPDHLKNKNYNYYNLGYDLDTVDTFFTLYVTHDPMISVGGFQHSFLTQIKNYTWTYKFNNKTY